MPGAWYVVEVFCLLSIVSFLWRLLLDHMDVFAVSAMEVTLVLVLAWATYKAKRLPSRILAAYIGLSALYFIVMRVLSPAPFTPGGIVQLILQAYFLIGAVLLWRLQELPTHVVPPWRRKNGEENAEAR
ncbi:MAG: hypothetical protein AUJ49_06885 [Desulfovibrionaceae bacterium CG1_02_65_16]|nr:MAG: hypothetical protein AUJ49_06885 [Desulfovibrionaceae bacterium CG1_02_65_16]